MKPIMISGLVILSVALIGPRMLDAGVISTTNVVDGGQLVNQDLSKDSPSFSDGDAYLFTERQSFVLGSSLLLNVSNTGAVSGSFTQSTSGPSPLTLAAGTTIDTFFLHFDNISPAADSVTGSITFDADIIGYQALDDTLDVSHAIVGIPGVTYEVGSNVDGIFDSSPVVDVVTVSADRRTLDFTLNASTAVDTIRIVTEPSAAVPEPGSLTLLGMGIAALGGVQWRRKRRVEPAA